MSEWQPIAAYVILFALTFGAGFWAGYKSGWHRSYLACLRWWAHKPEPPK